jgi:hypothetical protein
METDYSWVQRPHKAGNKRQANCFQDDDGNVEKATILSKKMITRERVLGIFGSTSQVVSHPIAEVCESLKVPLLTISPSRSISQGRQFVFIAMATTDVLTEFVCAYMSNVLHWKRVGILCESTEFGIDVSKLAEAFLKRIGVEVFMEKFTPTDVDVTPLWLKMKERNLDGVYLVASLGKVPAVAMKNRKSLGLTIPVIGRGPGQPFCSWLEICRRNTCYSSAEYPPHTGLDLYVFKGLENGETGLCRRYAIHVR